MEREYKDSGIEWIGKIPETWKTCTFSNAIHRMATGLNPRDNFVLTNDDVYYYVTIKNFKDGKLYLDDNCDRISPEAWKIIQERSQLRKGDILFASISKDGQAYLLKDEPKNWNINESVFCIRVNNNLFNNKYFYYHIIDEGFHKELRLDATGSTFQSVKQNKLRKSNMCIPPICEQQRIADYLDTKCGEIDLLIELQEQMIEKLKTYKQSVISEAVTKGLNPNVSVKQSGVDWIKNLPIHWNVITPKALFSLRKEKAKNGERQLTASQQYGVIYQDEYMQLTDTKIVTVMKDFDILKHVESGDFVISMRSFQGGLEYSENTGSISSAYVMLIPNPKYVYSKFYRWLFKSSFYINALQSTSNMVRDGQAMRYSNFVQVPLYVVPLSEQKEIASYLDEKCADIDRLIVLKQKKIEKLKEYKKSIIYEAVTGKTDLRDS